MRRAYYSGMAAAAWNMQGRFTIEPGDPAAWNGTVASWFIYGDKFHAAWSWWALSVVHLRPIEGAPLPKMQFDGATHEFLIMAVDPATPPNVDATRIAELGVRYLQPLDLVHQVGGLDDAQAASIADSMVRMICSGGMSPDSDFRSVWQQILTNTAQHIALGGHPKAST